MFRPLSFITVRQQHGETRHAQPFGFARADELVDDDLGAVDEIAELRLPDHERTGIGKTVAVFEAENGGLGQWAVDNFELTLVLAEMLERRVALLGLLIIEHGVALGESAAGTVLPGNAHASALDQERTP